MTASLEELSVAFKRKALAMHPDKNSDPHATAMFQIVSVIRLKATSLVDLELMALYLVEPGLAMSQICGQ